MSAESYSFLCPSCSAHLSVPVSMAGISGPCPYCASEITSPMPHEVPHGDLELISALEGGGEPPKLDREPVSNGRQPWESAVESDYIRVQTGFAESPEGVEPEKQTASHAATTTLESEPRQDWQPAGRQGKQRRRQEKAGARRERRQEQVRREEGSPLPRESRQTAPAAPPAPAAEAVGDVASGMSMFSKLCLGVAAAALVAMGAVYGLPKIMGDQENREPIGQPSLPAPPLSGANLPKVPIPNSTPNGQSPVATRVQPPGPAEANLDPELAPPTELLLPGAGSDLPVEPDSEPDSSPDKVLASNAAIRANPLDTDTSIPKDLVQFQPAPDSLLIAPRRALENFLMAPNWQERLKYCIGGASLEKTFQSYYARHHGGAMEAVDITYTHHETDPDGVTQFFLFTVSFEIDQNGEPVFLEFPVVVEQSNGKCLVEWETFAEFKDHHLQSFVDERPFNKPRGFHVIMSRDHFFGSDPELKAKVESGAYLCAKVQSPNPDEGAVAFLNTATSVGKALKDGLTWEKSMEGIPLTPYVELTWKRTASETPYIEVTKLVSDKWRTPKT